MTAEKNTKANPQSVKKPKQQFPPKQQIPPKQTTNPNTLPHLLGFLIACCER